MLVTVCLLADSPASVQVVADLRWLAWGHAPEPEDPEWWLATTVREAGREELPVAFVALDDAGRSERWAVEHGVDVAWVGTDLAAGFYERCGWTLQEVFTTSVGPEMSVLTKQLGWSV